MALKWVLHRHWLTISLYTIVDGSFEWYEDIKNLIWVIKGISNFSNSKRFTSKQPLAYNRYTAWQKSRSTWRVTKQEFPKITTHILSSELTWRERTHSRTPSHSDCKMRQLTLVCIYICGACGCNIAFKFVISAHKTVRDSDD